jgi:hypothetical protein
MANAPPWLLGPRIEHSRTGTNFAGVGLATARITPPENRTLLEYNIRRLSWQRWYKSHRVLAMPAGLFWFLSDYGRSTGRLLIFFFLFAFDFAALYLIPTRVPFAWMEVSYPWTENHMWPPHVSYLDHYQDENGQVQQLSMRQTWVRAVYYSVVTMTTLGFGDIYAHPERCRSCTANISGNAGVFSARCTDHAAVRDVSGGRARVGRRRVSRYAAWPMTCCDDRLVVVTMSLIAPSPSPSPADGGGGLFVDDHSIKYLHHVRYEQQQVDGAL